MTGGRTRSIWRQARRNPLTMAGLSTVTFLVLLSIFAPWIAPYPGDVSAVHPGERFQAPNRGHWFGTDELGRDILSRVVFGTRISFRVGALVVALALAIGLPLGIIAGTFGGMVDEILMRITDVFLSFPPLLLAMAISAILGASLVNVMIAIAIAWWPWYARLVFALASSLRNEYFVREAELTGASKLHIIVP